MIRVTGHLDGYVRPFFSHFSLVLTLIRRSVQWRLLYVTRLHFQSDAVEIRPNG